MQLPFRKLLVLALTCGLLVALPPARACREGHGGRAPGRRVFVGQASYNRAEGAEAGSEAARQLIRVNVNWTVVGSAAAQKEGAEEDHLQLGGYDRLVDRDRPDGIHVQLALTGPAPAVATVQPQGRARQAQGRLLPRLRARTQRCTSGPRDPLQHLERAELRRLDLARSHARRPSTGRSTRSATRPIKSIDPAAQVLIAETSPYALKKRATSPLAFLRGVTCAKATTARRRTAPRCKTDGYAHHPYDFDHKPTYRYPGEDNVTLATLSRLTSALAKLTQGELLRPRPAARSAST